MLYADDERNPWIQEVDQGGMGEEGSVRGCCEGLVFCNLPLGPLASTQVRARWILLCLTLCDLSAKFPFGEMYKQTNLHVLVILKQTPKMNYLERPAIGEQRSLMALDMWASNITWDLGQ